MMDVKDSRLFKMFNSFALSFNVRFPMFFMGVQINNKAVVTQNKQD